MTTIGPEVTPTASPDELTPQAVWHIAASVRDGKADPNDARRLLAYFRRLVSERRPIPEVLLFYIGDALPGGKGRTIEAALGLTKGKRGRRKADESERIEMAAKVLEFMVSGKQYKAAVADAAKHFGKGSTVIKAAWSTHKTSAYIYLARERNRNGKPWTATEKARITEIFDGKISWTPWPAPESSWPGAEVLQPDWLQKFGHLVRENS